MKFRVPFPTPSGLAVIALAAASLAFVSCQREDLFKEADSNGDGLIDKAEFSSHALKSIFTNADTDSSGTVNFDEWRAINPDADKSVFAGIDANSDGEVDMTEAEADFKSRGIGDSLFEAVDANKDGGITREEASAFMAEMEARAKAASAATEAN